MIATATIFYQSAIGVLEISGTPEGVLAINFVAAMRPPSAVCPPVMQMCVTELDEYFRGQRQIFTVKLVLHGTPFQIQVWRHVLTIPCGVTATYGAVAAAIGKPQAVRAVGLANGHNPLPIIIPCHRVIGANGKLTGYGGGLWRKEWLLQHERAQLL